MLDDRLAGDLVLLRVGAIDPATGTYRRSPLPMASLDYAGCFAGWLADSRHFVAMGEGEIALVDVETGGFRP